MSADIVQNWIITINLIVTTIVTFYLYFKSKTDNKKNALDSQLLELQRLAFENPYLENENYTNEWNMLREKYVNKEQNWDVDKFLRYDAYTEMLFNYVEMSLKVYKTEEDLLKYVDFKSWIRNHTQNWQNPLQAHINREVYGDKMCDMIDKWLK